MLYSVWGEKQYHTNYPAGGHDRYCLPRGVTGTVPRYVLDTAQPLCSASIESHQSAQLPARISVSEGGQYLTGYKTENLVVVRNSAGRG